MVRTVDLSFNKLGQMRDSKGTFEALFRLNPNRSSIVLQANGLTYLPGGTFLSNSNLRETELSRNAFMQLSLNVSYVHTLSILDLRFNDIKYLDPESRQRVELLYKNHKHGEQLGQKKTNLRILLEGNPFTCSCEALGFLQWFVASPIFNASYFCYLDGTYIPMTEIAVRAAEDECERPMRRRQTVSLSTLLPAFSLAAIITVVMFL